MKKVKIIVLLIVVGLIGLIGFQNREVVLDAQQFGINLLFYSYQSPEIPNFALLIAFFLAGLLLAYFSSLKGRFQSGRTIKELTGQLDDCREKIAVLEKDRGGLKAVPNTPEVVETGPDAGA
ncbi:MAG: LapA family protein [Thermodesulfobacteriota bacterium]